MIFTVRRLNHNVVRQRVIVAAQEVFGVRAAGFPTGWRVRALAVLLAIGALPAPANADAPRDIQTGQRLWLDGFDIGGADTTGNGGGANPASGAQVTAWKDKSPNGYTAGDATSYGAVTHTFPTYVTDSGVSFDGVGNALEVAGGIYPTGTTVSNTDIFIVGSTRTIRVASLFYAGFASSVTNDYRLNFHAPWTGGSYVWHHGTVNSALNVSWSGTGAVLGQKYIYNLGATTGSSQVLVRDGSTLGSLTSSLSYVQQTGASFYLGSGGTAFNGTAYQSYHDGLISEVIVYTRRLNTAEKNIIQSYLAAKYANPGGAGAASKYTAAGNFRYYVGGIGQESDGSLATGTSAGLTIANTNFLGNGKYLLAGVDSLSPASGVVATDAPTGFARRSQRVWYAQRSGTGAGSVTLTFNLSRLGISAKSGDSMALGYRSTTTGIFTALSTVTYSGTGTISFTATNPQTGYYVLATPVPPAPAVSLSLTSSPVSDGVNASNFKIIPGAMLQASAVATNSGNGSPDADTTVLALPIPAGSKLYVGDLGATGSGPVLFVQGATSSGLSYSYGSLASTTDRLDFSNDSGATWTYLPLPDAQQADAAITNLRVRLGGTFANGVSPNFPSFTLNYGLVVK